MTKIIVKTTKRKEIVDITQKIEEELAKQKIKEGICHLFVTHTTCALTTADLDPGTDLDMLDAIEKIIPNLQYRHPHDPRHTPDHIATSIIGTALSVPFEDCKLFLGTWQRIVLVELSGPRDRQIAISLQSA